MNLIAIALDNKTITVWNEGDIVDTVETRDIVVAMKFGSYNRYLRHFYGPENKICFQRRCNTYHSLR